VQLMITIHNKPRSDAGSFWQGGKPTINRCQIYLRGHHRLVLIRQIARTPWKFGRNRIFSPYNFTLRFHKRAPAPSDFQAGHYFILLRSQASVPQILMLSMSPMMPGVIIAAANGLKCFKSEQPLHVLQMPHVVSPCVSCGR
jgi:hypothetical protein